MPGHDSDLNLLFGITALQNDFITRDDLILAMNAWALEKHRPIGAILVERNALDPADRDALEAMIARRLAKHGGDPSASLAAISSVEALADDLRRSIADPALLDSIARASTESQSDPHATRAPATTDFTHPPTTRYRKVRDHAKGGIGIVYVALDEELKREVALKEIQPEHAHNPSHQSRFLLEAEITGGLEHPGIVPVYGLGHYDDGRPFYAMRFIKGESLKEAIAAFHADKTLKDDPGARTLALQKLLRRFLDVCNAVAYAHSRGVLHRDLKPANVMVGKYGETLVVDWGLAKSVARVDSEVDDSLPESTLLTVGSDGTLPGSQIGTPAYMSPEQAAGRIDLLGPASDVYGLGATLYTLLTGHVAFNGRDIPDLLHRVERGEFPRPRESTPWLDPALESITLKAMALRPLDRYLSPRNLADDLERWLADEPVTAYREPWTRRTRRWTRKHRTAVTTVASTSLVAVLLVGAYAWAIADRTRRANADGLASLARAEFFEAEARKFDDPARWSEAIAEARRAEAQLESGGGSVAAKARAMAKVAGLQAAFQIVERDRKMLNDLDEARLLGANVKEGHFDNKATADATLTLFRAYGIDLVDRPIEETASRVRSSRIASDLIAALDAITPWVGKTLGERLAAVARSADNDARGSKIREQIARKDFDGLRHLVADEAGRRESGPRCRTIFTTLAALDPTASLPVLEAIHRENRGDFWLTHNLARAYQEAKPPQPEPAVRHLYAAAALRPTSPGLFITLGVLLHSMGEDDLAIAACREAVRLKRDYAQAHYNLAYVLHTGRELELNEAIAECKEAIRLKPDFAEAHGQLGVLFYSKNELNSAIAECREAIRLGPDVAEGHQFLSTLHLLKGEFDASITAAKVAIRIKPNDGSFRFGLGTTFASKGDFDAAIAAYEEAIRLEPGNPSYRLGLGIAITSRGDFDAAIAAFNEAIRLKPDYAEAYWLSGSISFDHGRFAEALKLLEKGHELGSGRANWAYPSKESVTECRRLIQLEGKLPAILRREVSPKDADECLGLADVCIKKKTQFTLAVEFFRNAFAERPALADDLAKEYRYNAACLAARAGSGTGQDDPPPDEANRIELREQARVWLRADLASWIKHLDGDDPNRKLTVLKKLDWWKQDADLAGIRDAEPLAKLPEGERQVCRSLWADVETLRVKAGGGK